MKKKNILGTTMTVTLIALTIFVEIIVKTVGFFWVKILGKIYKSR